MSGVRHVPDIPQVFELPAQERANPGNRFDSFPHPPKGQNNPTRQMHSNTTPARNHNLVQNGRCSAKSYQLESGSPRSSSQSIQQTVMTAHRLPGSLFREESSGYLLTTGRVHGTSE
jgi:hypothetical protein